MTVFNDIQCAPCAEFQIETVDQLVERYARTGEARFEFRHFSLAPNDTTVAAIAAEAAGMQERQWQYLDTFVRNLDAAQANEVDDEFLREVAEAVPELELELWEEDFGSPEAEEAVRADAMLAAELELPAEPAVIVSGPAGERELIDTPSLCGDRGGDRCGIGAGLIAPDRYGGGSRRRRWTLRVTSSRAIRVAAPTQSSGSVG